jgi:ABC-2 type transport system permease protein
MNTTTIILPTGPVSGSSSQNLPPQTMLAVTQGRVVRSEWIKLRSVSSTRLGLLAVMIVPIILGGVFASSGDGGPVKEIDSLSLSLAGFRIIQLVIGVIGVVLIANEYSTGQIRSTLQSVRSRLAVLHAKSIVYAATVLVTTSIAAPVAFLVGKATYKGAAPAYMLSDPGVARVIIGTIFYSVCVSVMGVALGFLVRSAAGAIGILFASLLIVPQLVGLLPWSAAKSFVKFLPSSAGDAITTIRQTGDLLSPAGGAVVLSIWVVGLVVAASVLLQRRDA